MLRCLPIAYPSLTQSAQCLSDLTLLRIIRDSRFHYSGIRTADQYSISCESMEHWRAWRDWPEAYVRFILICLGVADERGLHVDMERANYFNSQESSRQWSKPFWMGWSRLHDDYRAYLYHLGNCELVADRICRRNGHSADTESSYVNRWVDRYVGTRSVYGIEPPTIPNVMDRLDRSDYPAAEANHYSNLDWDNETLAQWRWFAIELPNPGSSYLC